MSEYYEDITLEFDQMVADEQLREFGSQQLPGQPVMPLVEPVAKLLFLDAFLGFDSGLTVPNWGLVTIKQEDLLWIHALRWGGTAAVLLIATVMAILVGTK